MTSMTLDDLVVPGTAAAVAALEVASAYHSPALFNHSVRAYVTRALGSKARVPPYDGALRYWAVRRAGAVAAVQVASRG
jgi:hypothetical protein